MNRVSLSAMEDDRKVFSSSIIRSHTNAKNNFCDVLNIIPAHPVSTTKYEQSSKCSFIPKKDKYYVSKKKNVTRVKTVREIRSVFESDVYSYLSVDLEKQKNWLMRKIRYGSSREEKTIGIAKDILKSCNPITKSAWQMLLNINPEGHQFSSQYILYNGKHIQVNGSRGGSRKFLHKYDIGKNKEILNNQITKKSSFTRKIGLLQNSLNIKFKPGPLTKKKDLDTSFQKHHFGEMEIVSLPKPGLDICPAYGKSLAPVINTFVQNAFVVDSDGVISEKLAEFAVSMLGTNKKGTAVQLKDNSNITLDLDYKCFQHRILMRRDNDIVNQERLQSNTICPQEQDDSVILSVVNNIMDKIIDYVEIGLSQNELCFDGDEIGEQNVTENISSKLSILKDKGKRKYGELGRLDVTVIRIPDTSEATSNHTCSKKYCALGCICESLKSSYNFKTHCGRIDCMFQCKCDFSKYKLSDALGKDSDDIIRGLVNIEKTFSQTLAKEEHKFHQTVVVTDEKSILLNSQKRNWKTSKKYSEFYSGMQLKNEDDIKKMVSIVCTDLKIKNVEPWCMVHNLYKCFCKGKFTETANGLDENKTNCSKVDEKCNVTSENANPIENTLTKRQKEIMLKRTTETNTICNENMPLDSTYECCSARIMPYNGRKHTDDFYKCMNTKIFNMEQNDKSLYRKLCNRISREKCGELIENICNPNSCSSTSFDELLSEKEITDNDQELKISPSQNLIKWLESNYKKYKAQTNYGIKKPSLLPPRPGSMALYPWDFILARYREKKNHFLITKQIPYRIFMAVDTKHAFFDNFMNINDIALSDLDKYPATVKNLLTNATDLNDNFCILCGLTHCWELIGSVAKVSPEKKSTKCNNDIDKKSILTEKSQGESSSDIDLDSEITENSLGELNNVTQNVDIDLEKDTERSRWFIMTIENDFSEIQFYKRGFFVKYESIIKAIDVAKLSGKTVKLSSQNCLNPNNNFGIYAVPSDKDNYVFIGPYEKDESLGIETVKSKHDTRKINRTRGSWITTNKVDNFKVIDNPLLYMPSSNNLMVTLINDVNEQDKEIKNNNLNTSLPINNKGIAAKTVKPITIKKTNFYQLGSKGLFQCIPGSKNNNLKGSQSILLNRSVLLNKDGNAKKSLINFPPISSQKLSIKRQADQKNLPSCSKPIAEIAPQIKESTNITSSSGATERKVNRSMFVLKPEEINERLLQNKEINDQPQATICYQNRDMEMDIENFLKSFVVCEQPKDECFVISDDEDAHEDPWKNVAIVCKNVDNIGWIPARQDKENLLSFEFPGFKFSEFYKEDVAFQKISQVLSRKIYVPRHIDLEWEVLESLPDVETKKKLTISDLAEDYVLTKKGLRHKSELLSKLQTFNKTATVISGESSSSKEKSLNNDQLSSENDCLIKDLDETSKTLKEGSIFHLEKVSKNVESTNDETTNDLHKELNSNTVAEKSE